MLIKRCLLVSASLFAFSLVGNVASASAGQWYFFVQNSSNSTIKKLFVGEPNKVGDSLILAQVFHQVKVPRWFGTVPLITKVADNGSKLNLLMAVKVSLL